MSRRRMLSGLALLLVLSATPVQQPREVVAATPPAGGWSTPVNVSHSPQYDNAPVVAATTAGAVTIAWEHRTLTVPTSNSIMLARTSAPGSAFQLQQLAQSTPVRTSGNVRAAHDAAGRVDAVWWQLDGGTVCDHYARIEADGHVSVNEQVPGSCGQSLKNTALAVGPDNSAHMLFGRNLYNIFYWQRTDGGWTVRAEGIPQAVNPTHLAIGVTTGGVVLAAWDDPASKGGSTHLFAGRRQAANNWSVEDVSGPATPACSGQSLADLAAMAPDPSGGMRLIWLDARCKPRSDVALDEPFYREWAPSNGWNNQPPTRLAPSNDCFGAAITVDPSGVSYVAWVDNGKIFVTSGRGTNFAVPLAPFAAWSGGATEKDVALDYSPGYLHMAFGTVQGDPNKENYYSFLRVAVPPPPATPTPTLPSSPNLRIPGSGSYTFPETGQTLSGLFLDYWNTQGGLMQQGYPISSLLTEVSDLNHKPYTVQYFERAVFEYHPENQPPYNVLLSQLGTFRYKSKYPNGPPNQKPNMDASHFFPETGHWVGGAFWQYWQSHGGLMQQGYPISDEFIEVSDLNGKPYTVQYFERAVFEFHPENQPPYNVLLSQLGTFRYKQKYGGK